MEQTLLALADFPDKLKVHYKTSVQPVAQEEVEVSDDSGLAKNDLEEVKEGHIPPISSEIID